MATIRISPVNEYFCMRLAARSGLTAAAVELADVAGRPCLVVERFDREQLSWPPRRVHQEDLCQALGLTPDFKYQHAGWRVPSFRALADLLNEHSPYPGLDRLAGARAAVFNFLVGNADAHAKNIALLHVRDGVRLAPLYDLVSTACYPELSTTLAISVGDELNPRRDHVGALERSRERLRSQRDRVRAGTRGARRHDHGRRRAPTRGGAGRRMA